MDSRARSLPLRWRSRDRTKRWVSMHSSRQTHWLPFHFPRVWVTSRRRSAHDEATYLSNNRRKRTDIGGRGDDYGSGRDPKDSIFTGPEHLESATCHGRYPRHWTVRGATKQRVSRI